MAPRDRRWTWERLARLRRRRRVGSVATLVIAGLGPVLALLTFLAFGSIETPAGSMSLRAVLLLDLVYVLVLATLVLTRVARMVAARRARSAGSRLHLRLAGVFALIALIPTVTVALFAGLTVNIGLEGWFSDRVRAAVGASLDAAVAYEETERTALEEDTAGLARYLARSARLRGVTSEGEWRQLLGQGQGLVQRGLREAFIIDGAGDIRARGERSYLFDFEPPGADGIAAASGGALVLIEDAPRDEYRALVALPGFADRYLYVSRAVDGDLLALLDDTQETATLYHQLEAERGRLVFEFGLLYVGFAVILILAAIWLGLWFAERLARPVGNLAGAAQRVGAGDLDVQVRPANGDDEIAMLGRLFNQMTRQLKAQREALLAKNRAIEERRRLFDSVLSSVTAGVVGLDERGRVAFVNRAAERLLAMDAAAGQTTPIAVAVPEFGAVFDKLRQGRKRVAQEEVRIVRAGRMEHLLVHMAVRRGADRRLEGYVVAFDDVTELVSAQRTAAWGDVARRIAHEIKNPLTPIKLSAERIRRKFGRSLDADQASEMEQMTQVIVRQTDDLRRIVDEFSRFARMPQPERRLHDLSALVRDAVQLHDAAEPHISLRAELPAEPVIADIDATMIGQALTNLVKNAREAIASLRAEGAPEGHRPVVRIALSQRDEAIEIVVEDNGVGLPEDRARLFEPYVTTRDEGTGLGLPIVKKIIEEHGGGLTLDDAAPLDETGHRGARATVTLPAAQIDNSGLQVAE